ncbi:MAG: glutathione peroxidase [Treponema sp.]|nr:glutathione peroxidase [Treponema sp.]MBQ6566390.1 glutathione peroxidase [Treponema sp.]MBQ7166271.1 glutathione peroxidase [Treponema sp.]
MSIYDFTFSSRKGEELSMADYKGKVLLIVNTATGCGFTPQYEELQKIYTDLHDKGLEILDFPCNQFGNQAPGDNEEIHTFCKGRFGITFPQFAKIDVNGDNALPLYKHLTSSTTFEGFGNSKAGIAMTAFLKLKDWNYKKSGDIKWNFTKFLIDREGNIVKRYEPTADMADVRAGIENIL